MLAYYRNMLADLPVADSRISARVARTFLPAALPALVKPSYMLMYVGVLTRET
jgi:hypothetical protein